MRTFKITWDASVAFVNAKSRLGAAKELMKEDSDFFIEDMKLRYNYGDASVGVKIEEVPKKKGIFFIQSFG